MTQTQININSSSYRLDYRPRPVPCDGCGAPAVRRVWRQTERGVETANVCRVCAGSIWSGKEAR